MAGNDARIFTRIYNKRQASDYDDFMDIPLEEAYQLYPEVKSFVNIIIRLVKE